MDEEDDSFNKHVSEYTGYEVTCEQFVSHIIVPLEGVEAEESDELIFMLEAHHRVCPECEERVKLALEAYGLDSVDEIEARYAAQQMNEELERERQAAEPASFSLPSEDE